MSSSPDYLVFGSTGYLGTIICQLLEEHGKSYVRAKSHLENVLDVVSELDAVKPKHVLHAAGLTGRPNVDWCEDHKLETVRVNVFGTLSLADACYKRGIHMTYYATGCIYDYDENTELKCGGKPFTEEDEPNYDGSFYSVTKAHVEFSIKQYPNVLILRIRMPVSDDLHPRNFVTKIASYQKLINYPNSLTVLSDLMPISLDMAEKQRTGVYNFTNPGAISHHEIMDLYKKYIDPTKEFESMTLEDQRKILKAGRCNCNLDVSKLLKEYPNVPDIHTSMERVFQHMRVNERIG
eukprot:comp23401_c5_seq1/m.38825 comp23401_c5_seq1/g.38825  ORF comp23401_c5_seq1/g.38825 comp23401_c5_seq1/m.38825 type:complete len:293 (-) comp23401_c5_seq1:146-1024(-)